MSILTLGIIIAILVISCIFAVVLFITREQIYTLKMEQEYQKKLIDSFEKTAINLHKAQIDLLKLNHDHLELLRNHQKAIDILAAHIEND